MVSGPTSTAVNLALCVLFIKGILGSMCTNSSDTIPSVICSSICNNRAMLSEERDRCCIAIRMCSGERTYGDAVLVHTHDTETTGGATCTCTVMTSSPTNISVTSFSDVSHDDGTLSLRPRWTDVNVSFNTSGLFEFQLSHSDILDIVLNKTSNNTNTVYCLIVNATSTSGSINVTCDSPNERLSVTVVSKETTPSAVNNDSITSHGDNSTMPILTTPPVHQNTSSESVNNDSTEQTTPTTDPTTSTSSLPDRNVQLIVIGSAAAVGVVMLVLVVVTIVICRRKNNAPSKSSEENGGHGVSGGSYIDSTLQMSVTMPRPYDTYGRQFTSNIKTNINEGSDDVMRNNI